MRAALRFAAAIDGLSTTVAAVGRWGLLANAVLITADELPAMPSLGEGK